MTGQARRILFLLVLAVPLSFASGCMRQEYEAFRHERTLEEVRAIHAPLISGQLQLAEALDRLEQRAYVFELSRGGATRLETPPKATDLRDPSKAVFFEFRDPGAGGKASTAYLNPRTLSLEPIEDAKTGALSAGGGGWVRTGVGRLALLRSMPDVRPWLFRGAPKRSIYRFDFTRDESGEIKFDASRKLSEGSPWDVQPVGEPSSGRVAFLRRGEDERHRLMMTDLEGTPAWEVFPGAAFEIQALQLTRDGRLVFSSDSGGYEQLYEMEFTASAVPEDGAPEGSLPRVRLFRGEVPRPAGAEVLIANTSLGDEGTPQLLALPERYDLETLIAFASARNSEVNQKRALLAATIAEAAQRRYENWPVIDLSLFYTPLVGVFLDDPVVTSGDFLSEDIARGLFGVAQPLLDFRRNLALSRAELWRAEVARDAVASELNGRITEVAELYFEARHLERRLRIDEGLLASSEDRKRYFERLRRQQEATFADVLAAEQSRERIQWEADFNARRYEFLKSRLLEVCGLPEGAELEFEAEEFFLHRYEPEPIERLRAVALMNRPDLDAAEGAISRAFYLREAGPSRRPTAFASATYGQSRRDFTEEVDDFITLALQGKYPLGSYKVRQLFNEQWSRTLEAMHHGTEALRRATATSMEEAWMDFKVALRDYQAKRATLDYRSEELRVARLQSEYGPPGERAPFDPTTVIGARQSYLYAMAEFSKVEMELGVRFARLWREMGLAERLPQEAVEFAGARHLRKQPSIWMWYTRDALDSDAGFEAFVDLIDRHQPRRIYAYLYSDAQLLQDASARERLITLLQFCESRDVEVWALLGEPEWMEGDAAGTVSAAIHRILEFNGRRAALEPRFQGIKLDLEPHSQPGWHEDEASRGALIDRYLALLGAARETLNGALPLWADLSTQYFDEGLNSFVKEIERRVDGATVMAYFSDPDRIRREGLRALERFEGPLEIGVELSSEAPEDVRLPSMRRAEFEDLAAGLRHEFSKHEAFIGLALHDYRGVRAYFEEKPEANPTPATEEQSP